MSTTVIDALIVTLGLDPKGFKKGSEEVRKERDAMEKGARRQDTEEGKRAKQRALEAKGAADAIKKIRNEVVGMVAAFVSVSAIKGFIERITQSDAAVGRLSKNLGMSTIELSAWKEAGDKLGGTGEDIEGAFRNINRIVQDFRLHGGSDAQTPLARAGLDIDKFLARSTTQQDRMRMLADAYKKLSPQDAQSFGGAAGFSEGAINVLMRGSAAIDVVVGKQREMNATSERDAQLAQDRITAWNEITSAITGAGREMLNDATPAIMAVLGAVKSLVEYARNHMSVVEPIVISLTLALGALAAVKFAGLLSGIAGVSGALASAAIPASALMMILGKAGLVGAVGAASYGLATMLGADKLGSWLGGKAFDLFGPSYNPNGGSRTASGRVTGGAPASAAGGRMTRGMRNNNPGNLNYAGQEGATKESGPGGRFAVFQSMEHGVVALAKQLQLYASRGNDTVRGIISKYAPESENNTAAYIASMTKRMGVGPDQKLDLNNINVLREVIAGISTVENGAGRLGIGQINSGLAMFQAGRGGRGGAAGGTSSTDVKIGHVSVHTQATDAKGIAIDFGNAVNQHAFATNANSGMR